MKMTLTTITVGIIFSAFTAQANVKHDATQEQRNSLPNSKVECNHRGGFGLADVRLQKPKQLAQTNEKTPSLVELSGQK